MDADLAVQPRLRVTYLTQWFTPEPDGPANWIPRALSALGVDVQVLTGIPNYPMGRAYPGYRAWQPSREVLSGLPVRRVPLYPSHDRNLLRRVANFLSFAIAATSFGWRELRRTDVVLVYCSPATAAIPATLSRILGGRPYVLIVQDLWPESVLQTRMLPAGGIARVARTALEAYDRLMVRNASRIAVIAPGMARAYVRRGVPREKISTIMNWVDETVVRPHAREGNLRAELRIEPQELLFLYAGNHGLAQGLDAWLRAIALVQDMRDVHFVFMGEGTEKQVLVALAQELALERVHFLDPRPHQAFISAAADADALIVALSDEPVFEMTIPGKLQSAFAMAKSVLGTVSGDAAALIEKAGAGFVAAPGQQATIEDIIRRAVAEGHDSLRARGELARAFYEASMSQ